VTKNVLYFLTAFDRVTEELCAEFAVPHGTVKNLRRGLEISQTDWDRLECWLLTPDQARFVASLAGQSIDVTKYDYFLETSPGQ
jgi:hypothetical protein